MLFYQEIFYKQKDLLILQYIKSLYFYLKTDIEYRYLTSQFKVFHIEEQCRSKCKEHKKFLLKLRKLLQNYLREINQKKEERKNYKLINYEIIDHVTNEITIVDIIEPAKERKSWIIRSIATINNTDRILINNFREKAFTAKNNEIIIMWKKNKKR